MQRLYKPTVLLCGLFLLATATTRAEVDIPVGRDLQQDGLTARDRELPVMLVFGAISCPHCDELEEEFIRPMLLSGEYIDRILIRKLVLDNGSRVTDFSGQRLSVSDFAHRYGVFVTPTILFVDHAGQQLAERMVGINTIEMYGGYLDQCIDTALMHIREPALAAGREACRLVLRRPGETSPAKFNPATT
jgi:thioredoxin-related protein